MKRIVIYLGHPAHFHLFKNVMHKFQERGDQVHVVIKKKDILEELLEAEGFEYENILSEGKGKGKLSLTWSMLKRNYRLWHQVREFDPDVMLGTSAEIAHVGYLMNIPSYVFEEDDWDVIPAFARTVYPFATKIVAPTECRMGKWEAKTIRYNSYHELAYLHPDHFTPSRKWIESFHNSDKPYFILRFVELSAHHDEGIQGLTNERAHKLIDLLTNYGNVYITSERPLTQGLEQHRITLNPIHIHHALYFAHLYIGDSQTMAAESMILGTPSVRFNDFVGRISYLETLENFYKLGVGFKTHQFNALCTAVKDILENDEYIEQQWQQKRQKMLSEKINFANFIINMINQN